MIVPFISVAKRVATIGKPLYISFLDHFSWPGGAFTTSFWLLCLIRWTSRGKSFKGGTSTCVVSRGTLIFLPECPPLVKKNAFISNLLFLYIVPFRPTSPPPDPGHAWFQFDDSRVHPIRSQQIEKQFSGKESAYMLFYRRRSWTRPQDG